MNSSLGKEAKDYLINERKLTEEIIKEFNIGLALKDNKFVYTESIGEEPNRAVVIKPRED